MHNITDALETDVQNLELPELRKRGLDSDVFPGIVEVCQMIWCEHRSAP